MTPENIANGKNPWNQPVYAKFMDKVDPFGELWRFRPLDKAYNGDNTFWSVPSPEPDVDNNFWKSVISSLDNESVKQSAAALAHDVSRWEPDGKKLVFAAILRAGVPIADWLCRLIPGSVSVAISLFVGLGLDQVALEKLKRKYPDRKIVFVDGWTGRGGVAREISRIGAGPLAVLIDPWGWADFSGFREDIFCPTACFTGVATLGFSRTFYIDSKSLFGTYLFPEKYYRRDLVEAWQAQCPSIQARSNGGGTTRRFFKETDLRIHSNEVCRALINAAPDTLFFFHDPAFASEHYNLLLALASRRNVKVEYNAKGLERLKTRVACSLRKANA